MTEENRNLMILKTEREQAKIKLENQIASICNTLKNLESKLINDEPLYVSDGLQGNANNVDIYVSQLATYDRAIELFNRQLAENE